MPFTDPTLHGPLAKSDLTYCEGCHATPSNGGAGSDPRYNVPIGNLTAGCESSGCHDPNTAHPTQWRGFTATAPGGHRTAGNMANACVLCHGAALDGGAGPACSTCHTAGSPLTLTNCTSCHSSPPSGAAVPNRIGAHPVHDALADVVANGCNSCHNGGGTGTTNHAYGRTSAYLSFLTQYNAASGTAAYDPATDTCTNISCHGSSRSQTSTQASTGQSTPGQTPAWLTGAIDVNTQCTLCHVLGLSAGSPENNSYYSGHHYLHVYQKNKPCTACHDTTKLASVHFTSLTAPISEATASTTINSAVNFNGTTCNPDAGNLTGCHGSHTW